MSKKNTGGSAKHTLSDRLAVGIANLSINHPWKVIAAMLLLVVLTAAGAANLEFANNYRVFFGPNNPELVQFDEFQNTYTKNDNILFVIQARDSKVLTPRLAPAVEWLTEEAWNIPYSIRVDSVTNFQHSWADGDDLTVEDLVREGEHLSAEALARREAIALDEPLLKGNLISPDGTTTGVNVTLQYPEESLTEVPEAVAYARNLANQLEAKHPDLIVALSGVSMLNNAFAEAGQTDAMTLIPLMFGILVLFIVGILRSTWGTVATLAVIGLSTATALGLAGYAGIDISPISATAPVIILTLAIADSVHLLVTLFGLMREGHTKVDAIRESMRINFTPILITSLTTIVGFLTLNFSDSPPFWHLGNITAMGIAAALLYSLTILPAILRLSPVRVPAQKATYRFSLQSRLGELADWVTTHYKPVLALTGVIAVALVLMVPTIDLNDNFVEYFDNRVTFRGDAEFGIGNLNGIYLLEYSVEAAKAGGISNPGYLEHLAEFTTWLRTQPEVTHVYSYADIIKRLNKNMHGDDAAYSRIPDSRELAAQYLLLYELSLPYGLDLNDRINIDKSATRITASVGKYTTVEINDLVERSETWLATHTPPSMHAKATGAAVMFNHISERNIESMLTGNAIAVLLIAGIMMLALRSFGMGVLSLIPNAIPILMTFGLWAILVGQVGMAAATVSATSLGIVVDDTVHLLSKYLRARREKGFQRPQAIRYAFETAGQAIISTTIILSVGFAVLAYSTFQINAQMGLLTALAIVVALATDFLMLPALLMVGHRIPVESGSSDPTENPQRRKPMNSILRPGPITTALMTAAIIAGTLLVAGTVTGTMATGPKVETKQAASKGAKNIDAQQVPAGAAGALPDTETLLAQASTPEEKGLAIAARADRSDRTFSNSRVEMEMVLRNKAGKETRRTLLLSTLEVPDENYGDKSVIVFDSPADINGTALLSHARILDPDDQWLYLPALKRVKRISSVNKSGPFVGSEFAFEDFTSLELNKYEYTYLRSEPCGAMTCDVIERRPRYEHSGYAEQIAWIDQEVFQVRKVEFHDRRGDLLKTLVLDGYRVYGDGWWRPHLLAMTNHKTGKSTDLVYADYEFGVGLDDNDFVKGMLQRIR